MRKCGVCNFRLRRNESLSLLDVPGANGVSERVHACPYCVADATHSEPFRPRKYPAGGPTPPVPICGLCRLALYDGERTQTARITDEDVVRAGWTEKGIEPGAYEMCADCLGVWKPWIAFRVFGDHGHPIGGNALL